jgi:hypothetical protein
MLVTYTKAKRGYKGIISIEINSSKEFNTWAQEVTKELWDGMYFINMQADGTPVNFGSFVTEGEIALESIDFALMLKRIEYTKIKPTI